VRPYKGDHHTQSDALLFPYGGVVLPILFNSGSVIASREMELQPDTEN